MQPGIIYNFRIKLKPGIVYIIIIETRKYNIKKVKSMSDKIATRKCLVGRVNYRSKDLGMNLSIS